MPFKRPVATSGEDKCPETFHKKHGVNLRPTFGRLTRLEGRVDPVPRKGKGTKRPRGRPRGRPKGAPETLKGENRTPSASTSWSTALVASLPEASATATKCVNESCGNDVLREEDEEDNLFCKRCSLWNHYYCVQEKMYNKREISEDCFHCNRLKELGDTVEILMDEEVDDEEEEEEEGDEEKETREEGEENEADSGKTRGSGCDGTVAKKPTKPFVYYWNLFIRGMNVKVGDSVYLKASASTRSTRHDVIMAHIHWVLRDANGRPWAYFEPYLYPEQLPPQSVTFGHKEVIGSEDRDGFAPLSNILGHCCVLAEDVFLSRKPRGLNKANVYFARFVFNSTQELVPQDYSILDFKLNDKSYSFKSAIAIHDRV